MVTPARAACPRHRAQAAYFPVLPLLVKTVSNMTRHQFLPAEIIVQVVAGALAAMAVWALAARIGGHRLADRTVLLFCAFPGAMTFGMLYPEPLGTALAAGCLLAALNRKWLLAGLLALGGSAVHPALIVLAPTLAVTAARAIYARREWQSLIAPLLAPLGMAGYFGLLASRVPRLPVLVPPSGGRLAWAAQLGHARAAHTDLVRSGHVQVRAVQRDRDRHGRRARRGHGAHDRGADAAPG